MFPNRVFVTPKQVSASLGLLRILDIRYSLDNPVVYGIEEFQKKHVVGASFVDLDREITGPLGPHTTARHPMPSCETFLHWCKRRGIGQRGRPVLCYDDQSGGMGACRMWWMLDAVGVEAYVLDGGIQAYVAEGLPTASGGGAADSDPKELSVDNDDAWVFSGRHAFHAYVEANEIPLAAKIVDARLAPRFQSTVRPLAMDTVPGHMPGAVNHPWTTNLDDSIPDQKKLLPLETLTARMVSSLGGSRADDAVFTCASGVTACINIAVARHTGLGHPKLYAGAWSEYSGLHKVHLLRQTIDTYGMCLTMKTKNLMVNPKVTSENVVLVVDGVSYRTFDEVPALAQSAALHMFLGEKATVHFKSGTSIEIEAHPK